MSLDIVSCMKSFITVSECGSFTQAAQKLYLSTSVITKQVQTLEKELGTMLLIRTTRTMALTTAGEIYLKKAKYILNEINNAKEAAINVIPNPRGLIKLALPGFFQSGKFIKIIANFLSTYPEINISIINNMSPYQLLDKTADIVISEFKIRDAQINCERLIDIKKSVFASPKYVQLHGAPKTVNDLSHHNCLIYEWASPTHEWIFKNNVRVKVNGNYTVIAGVSLVAAACEGIGLTWVPDIIVEEEVSDGRLVKLDIEPGPFIANNYLYSLPIANTGIVKLFINYIHKEIESLT